MITTIIFDLSEVYLHGMYGIESIIAARAGMPVIDDSLHTMPEAQQFFNGQITEDAFWTAMITHHDWPLTVTELKKLIRAHMKEIDGTRAIIEKLKSAGYRLGLLSVNTREWVDHCESVFDFHKLFHSVMYSFEVGVCKPDPKAFELILEKLAVKPEECLFIDDSATNIAAADKLGIQTILFKTPEQLQTDLQALKISY
jgi:epoxide hydrolase-like predicted phosphatase